MLEITIGWSWFHSDPDEELQKAFHSKRLCAIMQEDGDVHQAVISTIKAINAPTQHICFAKLNTMFDNCVLVVAWDDRFVNCTPEDEEDDWDGF